MKQEIPYDLVFVELVPRIVDTNPQLFLDDAQYWVYSSAQVREFLGKFPEEEIGKPSEQRFESEKAARFTCDASPYGLSIGFKPAYYLGPCDRGDTTYIACPTFDVAFKPVDLEVARRILQAGLEQFFLRQADIDGGTIAASGLKNKTVVHRDLDLLRRILPVRTSFETRCNWGLGNGKTSYVL